MSFVFDVPEDMGGESAFLQEGGIYHALVSNVYEGTMVPNKDGVATALKNGGFSVSMEVAAGVHKDKKFNLIFNNGDYSHKDQGKMARVKQAMFAIACDLMQPGVAGQQSINLQDATGSNVILELETEEYDNNGKKGTRVQLRFSNIYHIDDPRAPKCERDEVAIKAILPENRHDKEYFAPLQAKKKKAEPAKQSIPDDEFADIA